MWSNYCYKIGAENDPQSFVNMALSLYQTGSAKSLTGDGEIKANSKLLQSSPTNGLSAATYVIFTCIRDSYNSINDYDPKNDGGMSGLTLISNVSHLLRNYFNLNIISEGGTIDGTNDHIKKHLAQGHKIIALFDLRQTEEGMDAIRSTIKSFPSSFRYYYGQIMKLEVENQTVKFNYWNPNTSSSSTNNEAWYKNFISGLIYYFVIGK